MSTLSPRSSSSFLKREYSYQQLMRIFFGISIGVVLAEVHIFLNGTASINKCIVFLNSVLLIVNSSE